MAALCPGVQYGLSSQENFGENKDLIFVKLTDSALRTIEEYLRNQNKYNKSPTIKFLGNEGQLSFPNHNGSTSFNFSVSSTSDMEGPGGSFECLHQPPRGSLNVLGPIPHKMRIHANDDVYEATRHRMSVLEENTKNKCAREIKMNQTDIGRKVKVKQGLGRPVPPTSRRDTPPSRDALSKPSYPPNLPSKPIAQNHNNHHNNNNNNNNNGLSNGLGSNYVSSSKPQNKPSMPDIAKRPIKERMIHLLALKPFKKLELYERLNREGLRERNAMHSVLKQIACLKDNSYHLNRAMWNDVHEDWPFYTESEKQILKRRKPQNLTPPGSSDGGSSGSGHSPTSTHPGSPPPPIAAASSKRPGYYDGADGLPTKRQRISHYRKPSEQTYRSPVESNSQRRPMTDSRDASNMNPRSRESPPLTNGYSVAAVNGYSALNDKRNISDDEDHNHHQPQIPPSSRKRACDSNNVTFDKSSASSPAKNVVLDVLHDHPTDVPNGRGKREETERLRERERWGKVSSSSGRMAAAVARVSPDSQSERMISAADSGPPMVKTNGSSDVKGSEFPDYLTEYTSIKDIDQRRRYKAEFNADYAEYRELHAVVEKVSRRFAELEERLKQEDTRSPKYKDIKKQIVREYQQNKQDREQQKAKRRFQYLHDKLSHIKRLVFEYDQEMADSQY